MAVAEASAAASNRMPVRHVAAVVIGNALEFYDFLTYSYFSIYIGKTFFPSSDPAWSLLLSLATFGIGFIMRPLGGYVIGRMGDTRGRRPAMMLSMLLMGIAVAGMALTPSYASIGIAAPALVIVFRLVQGFALGGQVGPATSYMLEAAPPRLRGFYSSLQYASQDTASLVAGIVGVALSTMLTNDQLVEWGWRVAVGLGVLAVPYGLWLRSGLPETAFEGDDETRAPRQPVSMRPYIRPIALTIAMLGAATIANYTITYLTTYTIDTLHLPATVAFGAPIVGGICFVISEPLSGWLSDKWGRKPLMIWPGIVLLLAIYPLFYLLNAYPGALVLYVVAGTLVILQGLCTTPILTSFTETIPKAVRAGTVGIVYAVAIAIFGGSTQFVVKWLIETLHDPMAPAYYMTATFAIGLVAMFLTRETAPSKTGSANA
jgi:MFS family permease